MAIIKMVGTRMFYKFNTVPNTRNPFPPYSIIIIIVIMVIVVQVVSMGIFTLSIVYNTIYVPFLLKMLSVVVLRGIEAAIAT